MKKKPMLVLSTTLLLLISCGSKTPSSISSDNSNPSSIPSSDYLSTSSEQQSSSTVTQETALKLFDDALKQDYSNVTIMSYQSYQDGQVEELDYEYVVGQNIVDYAYYLELNGYDHSDCLSYYHIDDKGESWLYFEADSRVQNSKGGWMNKGLNNADLSIWNAYFYLPLLLNQLTLDSISYTNGLYYVNDNALLEKLNTSAFGYFYGGDVIDICFLLSDGHISKIYGFCDNSLNPVNYVEIQLYDFGTTQLPSEFKNIPSFSEETKTTYWQYKGWPQDYEEVFYEEVNLSLAKNQEIVSSTDYDVILELDKSVSFEISLSPNDLDPWYFVSDENKEISWHYDETILEKNKETFRAIKPGETEVYATIKGSQGKEIKSKVFKIKVNALQVQDKTNAKFDFSIASIGETYDETLGYEVTASNNILETKAPFTIHAGPGAKLLDGKNSDILEAGKNYLTLDPVSGDVLNKNVKTGLYFDLGEQQVSKVSFNYALFYENQLAYLNKLSEFKIRTSNDGVNFEEQDLVDVIKENISTEFVKLLEVEFAPASIVQIVCKGSTIGNSLKIALDSICMFANENCHNYVAPEDIHVENVTISSTATELFVGETTSLTSVVTPLNAIDSSVTWHVEEGKENVLSVSESGVVTGLSSGSAKVYATSNDGNVKSNEITITVSEMATFSEYVGNVYKDEYVSLTIVDATHAKVTGSSYEVVAEIKTVIDENFVLENENGEGFTLSLGSSNATVSKIKYLSNGELQEAGGTRYCEIQIFMTSFKAQVSSLTLNADNQYDVFKGETKYISITSVTPSNANNQEVVYESLDATKATVDENGMVTFIDTGVVTIRVSDASNPAVYDDVVFNVLDKIYPNETNWSLNADKSTISVGQEAHLTTQFDESINADKTVRFSSSDTEIASVNSKGVVTGKAEGTVTITATVTGASGEVTKTVEITVEPASASEILPAAVTGAWSGSDFNGTTFTFTINGDGSASLSDGADVMNATFNRVEGTGWYYFTTESGEEICVNPNNGTFEITSTEYCEILGLVFMGSFDITK